MTPPYNPSREPAVLSAKRTPPAIRPDLVERLRLLNRLDRGLEGRIILLSAPAGYGKTTLLAQWLDGKDHPRSWLSLDSLDNDLPSFAAYLLAAVRDAYPLSGENLALLLNSPQQVPTAVLADALIEDLAILPGALILVLDDFHLVDDPEVTGLIERLIQFLPSNVHLVISTRTDPDIPLSRLRALGEIADIRMVDLQFNLIETGQFLHHLTGQVVDEPTASMLEQHTEGWAIGLQLAGLTMRDDESPEAMVQRLPQLGYQYAAEFLMEELLMQQDPPTRDFLLRTSILERLNESLCMAITGSHETNGMLKKLWRANQLIVPLDEKHRWFRYHHLFRQFLHQRLRENMPANEVDSLHRLASAWLAENGFVSEAISHAISGHDLDLAVHLCEANFTQAMNREEWWRVARWLELLPASVMERPALLVAQGWLLAAHSKPLRLSEVAAHAERSLAASDVSPSERRSLQAQIDTQKAVVAYWMGDAAASLALAQGAVAELEPHMTWALGIAHLYTGVPLLALGRLDEATRRFQSVIDSHLAADDVLLARIVMGQCLIHLEIGNMPGLKRTGQVMGQLAERSHLQNSAGWADFVEGYVAYETNDLVQAEAALRRIVDTPHAFNSRSSFESHLTLALTLQALGRHSEAEAVAENLRQFLVESNNLQALPLAEALEQRLHGGQYNTLAVGLGQGPSRTDVMFDVRMSFIVSPWLAQVRALLRSGTPDALCHAGAIIKIFREEVESLHLDRRLVEVLGLQALFEDATGNKDAALGTLRHCIRLAEQGRMTRMIVDSGPALIPLLESLLEGNFMTKFVARILGAYATTAPDTEALLRDPAADLTTHLSHVLTFREQEVLALLAGRLSDKEIASRLVVAPNTVKKYTAHIYRKLGVNNRRAAVTTAVRLGLIPPLMPN